MINVQFFFYSFFFFMLLVCSPLEQFQLFPLFFIPSIKYFSVETGFLPITNATGIIFLGVFFFCFFFESLKQEDSYFSVVPNRVQVFVEFFVDLVLGLVKDCVGNKGEKYFPFLFSLFSFIVIANLIGLIPCSFTITSHLSVCFSLAIITFFGMNCICIFEHKYKALSLFLPSGSSLLLSFILVPIEFVSYFVRPISLSVRLFANMMAGHTLLKVVAGFSWIMMLSSSFLLVFHLIPLFILIIVMGLETGVALIQAYVFTVLTCIYLNDALNLH
jgi:F-type H+-transporting ATPase subunit a